jgi:adenylate cyclase
MQEIIYSKREVYQAKYNLLPQFKAGIHAGKVIVTEVGKIKKDIVYHGDVLNTTSRIEGKCNELNQQLLVSEDALKLSGQAHNFGIEEKGEILLRGKARNVKIFAVHQGMDK